MDIKRININEVRPGMRVADNAYNSVNQLIVPKDSILTDKAIARMRFHSILSIKIFVGEDTEPEQRPAAAPSAKSDSSYFDKLRETEEYISYNRSFNNSVASFEDKMMKMIRDGGNPDTDGLTGLVQSLHSSCRNGIQVFDLLHCMRSYDDITFAHSLNVALICATIGSWLGYDNHDIELLMQCGIFHDVGKLLIPKNIVDKPSTLTSDEYAIMKTHTSQGYSLLKTKKLDNRVKLCAVMHHERCDGSGYPLNLKSAQIDDFAKILAIADVYEAMTSPRVYRNPKCPFDVITIFEKEGLSLFDPKFLMTFMENIASSYMGNRVRLSDGTVGTIIYINKLAYSRPMIQINDDEYIDLTKKTNLYIEAVL